MEVKFFYQGRNQRKPEHEIIVTEFAKLVGKVIELPDIIEVCLYPLQENIHGGIDILKVNRLGLNINLPLDNVPKVLTHELIHVNQKHKDMLRIDRTGRCYWYGIPYNKQNPEEMNYQDYLDLPWEADVQNRLDFVFKEALNAYNKT